MSYGYIYSIAQIAYLRRIARGRSYAHITELFNKRFDLNHSVAQIGAALKYRGIRNGLDARIKPGNVPHNKGKPGNGGWKSTQFKKGHMPHNYRPVGSERVNRDGYTEIKVADPKTWRLKHVVVYEAEFGYVPKGCAVIFGDGDRRNFDLDNLLLVTKGELMLMNKFGLIMNDAELTKTGILIADIHEELRERKRTAK